MRSENTCGGKHKAHTSRNVGLGTEATAGLGGDGAQPRNRAGTHRVLRGRLSLREQREDAACATLNRDGAMPRLGDDPSCERHVCVREGGEVRRGTAPYLPGWEGEDRGHGVWCAVCGGWSEDRGGQGHCAPGCGGGARGLGSSLQARESSSVSHTVARAMPRMSLTSATSQPARRVAMHIYTCDDRVPGVRERQSRRWWAGVLGYGLDERRRK